MKNVRQDVRRLEYELAKRTAQDTQSVIDEVEALHAGCRVHGADIYIQTNKPMNPKVGDLWYNTNWLLRVNP